MFRIILISLLLILLLGCATPTHTIQIVTVLKLPEPITEEVPKVPLFKMKEPIVWTVEDLQPIVYAYESYNIIKLVGETDAGFTALEVEDETGYDEDTTRNFLIYALPSNDWQYLEFVIDVYSINLEMRANVINSLNKRMKNRHTLMIDGYDKTMQDLKELGTIKDEKSGWWPW